jgi:hypothetical protein
MADREKRAESKKREEDETKHKEAEKDSRAKRWKQSQSAILYSDSQNFRKRYWAKSNHQPSLNARCFFSSIYRCRQQV